MNRLSTLCFAIVTALAPPITALAQPHMFVHNRMHLEGRIASIQGDTIRLENGATVYLRQGTVIRSGNRPLHVRQFVSIMGTAVGNGNVNASEVDVAFHH